MAKEAYPFLIPPAVVAGLGFAFGITVIGWLFLLLAVFVAFFFRDPERSIPIEPAAIVSPADGKVVNISSESDGSTRVSIFLSVFNVHINRSPIGGKVESIHYLPGKFKVAFNEQASLENEQSIWLIDDGLRKVKFSQIAGILARRIVSWKRPGETVEKGERVGLIRFGSRVDIFLPKDVTIGVSLGDTVQGGSSIVGRFNHV
jgi:phosphatidylserine decarboxylase